MKKCPDVTLYVRVVLCKAVFVKTLKFEVFSLDFEGFFHYPQYEVAGLLSHTRSAAKSLEELMAFLEAIFTDCNKVV